MANELKVTYLSQVTVTSDSATLAAGAISPASAIVAGLSSTNHSDFQTADAVLTFSGTNSISSVSNYIILYRRDLNIDGTADANPPSTAYSASTPTMLYGAAIGAFICPANSSATTFSNISVPLADIPLSRECEFYIDNRTNIPIGAGWILKVTPKSLVPGA